MPAKTTWQRLPLTLAAVITTAVASMLTTPTATAASQASTWGATDANTTIDPREFNDHSANENAPIPAGDFVDLVSASQRSHILDGEARPSGAFDGRSRAGL